MVLAYPTDVKWQYLGSNTWVPEESSLLLVGRGSFRRGCVSIVDREGVLVGCISSVD